MRCGGSRICRMAREVGELAVWECRPEEFAECELVFSGLDSEVAGEIELEFLKANLPVFSNAKNHRRDPIVPLVVPTVNLAHLDVIPYQRGSYGQKKGFLICNSNCAVIGIVIPFAAMQAKFGPVDQVSVVTMQAVWSWLSRRQQHGHIRQRGTFHLGRGRQVGDGGTEDSPIYQQ